jgi:RalA-binding protein 1
VCGSAAWDVGRFRDWHQSISRLLPLRSTRGRPDTPFPVMSSGQSVQKPTGVGPTQTNGARGDTVLTLAGVLSSYISNPNPPMAALDQVISERNTLSSQNSQLWKLVEKQRSGYSQILKELERVRSERDTFKARLTSLGENPDQILKKQKASKGSSTGNKLKPSSSHSGLRSDDGSKMTNPEDPRQAVTRHQSDDSGTRCMWIFRRIFLISPDHSATDPRNSFPQ